MSTVDRDVDRVQVHTKGAPEELLSLCTAMGASDGQDRPLTPEDRVAFDRLVKTGPRRVYACWG
jgi:magnesium-transporting ATPase (P-type)